MLASLAKKGKAVRFSGKARKNEPHLLPCASEASAWLSNYEK
ncbi:MAG: hypothetical protein U5L45_20590 [Saprospiraceae bacterium]|nr:hypothetical protein [Saprospiraceae bacterium]